MEKILDSLANIADCCIHCLPDRIPQQPMYAYITVHLISKYPVSFSKALTSEDKFAINNDTYTYETKI